MSENWLKKLREKNNLTQKELSLKTGLTKSTIENIEQGKRKGSQETLKILNEYFNSLKNENISFESEDLIEELKEDIEEFGKDEIMYALFEIKQNYLFLTNYDFIIEGDEDFSDKEEYDLIVKMRAEDILKFLEIQNRIC